MTNDEELKAIDLETTYSRYPRPGSLSTPMVAACPWRAMQEHEQVYTRSLLFMLFLVQTLHILMDTLRQSRSV